MIPSIYSIIVYSTLITSIDNDWRLSSPDYLSEKSRILSLDERDAYGFGYLDVKNMKRAVAFLEAWHVEIPPSWKEELRLQLQAAEEWFREQESNNQLAV